MNRKETATTTMGRQGILGAALVSALAVTTTIAHGADALPSWNEGKHEGTALPRSAEQLIGGPGRAAGHGWRQDKNRISKGGAA
jgi:hypothetical protein